MQDLPPFAQQVLARNDENVTDKNVNVGTKKKYQIKWLIVAKTVYGCY